MTLRTGRFLRKKLPAPEWPNSFSSQAWLAEAVVGGFGSSYGIAVRSLIWLADLLVHSGGMSGNTGS